MTSGKSVFVKFLAPNENARLGQAWDKLVKDFEGSTTTLVADVDCTEESGQDLCGKHGAGRALMIKYGAPDNLKVYKGGFDYQELKQFAAENLGPTCGPDLMELCDAKAKEKISKYMTMP